MKHFLLALVAFASTTISTPALALEGALDFSETEIRQHASTLPRLMDSASACLQADLDRHYDFYAKWRISPFYGDQSSFAKSTPAGRREYLRRLRFDEAQIDSLLKTLEPTSCIGLTLKCLEKGFLSANQANLWTKLRDYVKLNGTTGAALQDGLQRLGWKTLYWNPDVSRNEAWDAQERADMPTNPRKIWGEHAAHWRAVQTKRKYLYNRVDDIRTLVNFGRETPAALKPIPFFVGVAHVGYHVFPGSFGQIIEAHSTRQLNDAQTVETSPFNPLAEGGGPRGQYRSGLIAVPPGYVR